MMYLLATLLSLATVSGFYLSWKQQASRALWLSIGLLVVSCIGWSYAAGWEYGLVYALCIPSMLVWLFIWQQRKSLGVNKAIPHSPAAKVSAKLAASHMGRLLVVLIIQALISLLLTLVFCYLLPLEDVNRMALGIVLLPLVWALLSYQLLQSRFYWRSLSIQMVVGLLSAGGLAVQGGLI
ncbi:hypothetical protein [Neptunicella marina]|uniref:Uncharacterized protein n=1 Tax=Neptunicella marina TaxID=2125989 RepID=A0A8J6ITJ9_9ALTE|nr:hypothetical protein [Neptunicella marina]MBC3765585.1 hypothetical protein [Neptunicella marina]